MIRALLLILVLAITPPPLTATWQRPTVARLAWSQPSGVRETCVVRIPAAGVSVLIGCWYDLPAGATGLTLGSVGPADASFKPQAGDTFQIAYDGAGSARSALRGVVVLPVLRR